jgi:NitT/TauT family transport system substrate-binding protein
MRMTRRRFLAALPALALTARGTLADDPIRLNIPGPRALPFLPLELIKPLGLDREQGSELVLRHFPSGVQAMDDVLAGNAHFAAFAFSITVALAAKGLDAVAVVPVSGRTPPFAFVVRNDLRARVRAPRDLKGRSIGVSVGSATTKTYLQSLAEIILATHGVRADEVRWVGTAQNMAGQRGALGGRVVDAAFCEEPFVSGLVSAGIGHVLLDVADPKVSAQVPGLHHLRSAVATTRRLAQQDPQRVARLVRMVKGSLAWISRHSPAELIDRLEIADPTERQQFLKVVTRLPHLYSSDGRFSAREITSTREFIDASTLPGAGRIDPDTLVLDTWAGRTS